ncbi:TolC family protein [hot springs metagenome]|uniref:TolC family protein n=1 Tax=hot springs metagenome TaxID=433727 RepID=A0A5J4L2W7_9ZZZZ
MKSILNFLLLLFISSTVTVNAEMNKTSYTLSEIIEFAINNNPGIIQSVKDIEIEKYGLDEARAYKNPQLNFNTGITRYRYASPITPISGSPMTGSGFPEFDNNIYDFGFSFVLPIYRGGRLDSGVRIAEIKKSIAEDISCMTKNELIYNLINTYYKIIQLEKLLKASEATVKQLEFHKKKVETFLKAGTVPKVELLKTEVELAHAKQNALLVKNSLESSCELLKTLMGIEDVNKKITIVPEDFNFQVPSIDNAVNRALSLRPDYTAILKKKKVAQERIKTAKGKRLPEVYFFSEFYERSGDSFEFKENWNIGIRLNIPIFDGGVIKSQIDKEIKEMEKIIEEERTVRLNIIREIKDAYLNIEGSIERISVSQKAVEEAKENLRIEILKFETGSGTSTDVIDAQTALLRAETDYLQAIYDKNIAIVSLIRAMGEILYGG